MDDLTSNANSKLNLDFLETVTITASGNLSSQAISQGLFKYLPRVISIWPPISTSLCLFIVQKYFITWS